MDQMMAATVCYAIAAAMVDHIDPDLNPDASRSAGVVFNRAEQRIFKIVANCRKSRLGPDSLI